MKEFVVNLLGVLLFVLPLSMCFVSCEGFDLEEIFGNIIKPSGGEEKEYQYFFEENFVDSLDAVYCDEGYIALFGFEEVEVAPDCFSEERVVYIGRVENEKFMTDDAVVIVVDSTNFPVRMAMKDVNAIFSKVDDKHFNCAIYTAQSGEWIELENLSYESSYVGKSPATRALATSGYSEFGLDDALTAISIASSLKDGYSSALKNDQLGVLKSNIGVFGDLLDNDEFGLGIGLATAPGILGKLLAVGGYLSEKYDDFVVRELGKVRLAIEDLKRHDGTTCEIFFSISGLNENGLKNSEVGMVVYNTDAMFYMDFLKSANYEDSRVMKLPTGRYTVEVYVRSTKYSFIGYRVMYTFSMFELGIDHYTVAPDAEYSDGKVMFDVEVFLSGDSEELNKWISSGVEFGYYVHYANAFDYKKVTNFSTIFSSTPLTYDLAIEREGFFEENIDYTSFKARSADYHIGAYAVVDGKILTYDEQEMELVYDEHPEAHTGESSSVSETEATVKCEFEDCLFWSALRGVEYFTDSKSESILLDANKEDGEYDFHLDGLTPNTTYKYRAYYEVNGVKEYGETKSFKTNENKWLKITTANVSVECSDGSFDSLDDLKFKVHLCCSASSWASDSSEIRIYFNHERYYLWDYTTTLAQLKNGCTIELNDEDLDPYDIHLYTINSKDYTVSWPIKIKFVWDSVWQSDATVELNAVYQSGEPNVTFTNIDFWGNVQVDYKNSFWVRKYGYTLTPPEAKGSIAIDWYLSTEGDHNPGGYVSAYCYNAKYLPCIITFYYYVTGNYIYDEEEKNEKRQVSPSILFKGNGVGYSLQ